MGFYSMLKTPGLQSLCFHKKEVEVEKSMQSEEKGLALHNRKTGCFPVLSGTNKKLACFF